MVPKKMKESEGKWDRKRRKKNWGDGFSLFLSSVSPSYDIWMCLVPKKIKENERKCDRKRRKKKLTGVTGFS